VRGGGGSGQRDGEGEDRANSFGGGCGKSGQSAAMSHAERRLDDHVVGLGVVRGDGVRQRAADQFHIPGVHAAVDGGSSAPVWIGVGGDAASGGAIWSEGSGRSGVGAGGAGDRQCNRECVKRLTHQRSADPAGSDFESGARVKVGLAPAEAGSKGRKEYLTTKDAKITKLREESRKSFPNFVSVVVRLDLRVKE